MNTREYEAVCKLLLLAICLAWAAWLAITFGQPAMDWLASLLKPRS